MVPVEGTTRVSLLNNLLCPTSAQGPIESQCVFSRLSHHLWRLLRPVAAVGSSPMRRILARRTLTRASSVEMVTIDPLDLKEAQDRECNRSPETTREKTD